MEASPLRKLPQELRDEIYGLALYRPGDVYISYTRRKVPNRACKQAHQQSSAPSHLTSLTTVCKELREEALSVFFKVNTFCFETEWADLDPIHPWIVSPVDGMIQWTKEIGPVRCASLRNVDLVLYYPPGPTRRSVMRLWTSRINAAIKGVRDNAARAVVTIIIRLHRYGYPLFSNPQELRIVTSDLPNEISRLKQAIEEVARTEGESNADRRRSITTKAREVSGWTENFINCLIEAQAVRRSKRTAG